MASPKLDEAREALRRVLAGKDVWTEPPPEPVPVFATACPACAAPLAPAAPKCVRLRARLLSGEARACSCCGKTNHHPTRHSKILVHENDLEVSIVQML